METNQLLTTLRFSNDVVQKTGGETHIHVAGPDIVITKLDELEQPLDKFNIKVLLQKCLQATIPSCIYCNYAKKISVNGKQLGLHAIAEHRFSGIVRSITAEELSPKSFVARVKQGLAELENVYFNIESNGAVRFPCVFECFQCRFSTTLYKELHLHIRKNHVILNCIMCKSVFYRYSEFLCHLCPGIYPFDTQIRYRCCMCSTKDLPSAFRLLVHLRRTHNACDVCLELCQNQAKLSTHITKHKVYHCCYRCDMAYLKKLDLKKHLFWKHGTETVLCKKCLEKKWHYAYHFCIPPAVFTCEDCEMNFKKAVSLRVHRRIHTNEKLYGCVVSGCKERFISKKLLLMHEFKHREPKEESESSDDDSSSGETSSSATLSANSDDENSEEEKLKAKNDLYNIPELNLSESDSNDEGITSKSSEENITDRDSENPLIKSEIIDNAEETQTLTLENVWSSFINYQTNKTKLIQETATDAPNIKIEPSEENEVVSNAQTFIDESYLDTTESESDEDFYDEHPFQLEVLPKRQNQSVTVISREIVNKPSTSRNSPATKKSKKKYKKQKKKNRNEKTKKALMIHPYENRLPPVFSMPSPPTPNSEQINNIDPNLRSSKRRRVRTKYYGYSSDEDKSQPKRQKSYFVVNPSQPSTSKAIPPIVIKTVPPLKLQITNRNQIPMAPKKEIYVQQQQQPESDSTDSSDSGDEDEDEEETEEDTQKIYCHCQQPFKEDDDIIGCASAECEMKWFHYQCVGIMVPPKRHWFCPYCRKRKQQRKF